MNALGSRCDQRRVAEDGIGKIAQYGDMLRAVILEGENAFARWRQGEWFLGGATEFFGRHEIASKTQGAFFRDDAAIFRDDLESVRAGRLARRSDECRRRAADHFEIR